MALKTNSKEARAAVMAYIREWCADYVDGYSDGGEYKTDTDAILCASIMRIYAEEWKPQNEWNRRRYGSPFESFKAWAYGLPMGGLFCYVYNRSAVDDLGAILRESDAEKARYTEEAAENLLTLLIFRELEKRSAQA